MRLPRDEEATRGSFEECSMHTNQTNKNAAKLEARGVWF